jgi:hypothetical protein
MEEETPTKLREATGGAYTASLKVSQKHCAVIRLLPTRELSMLNATSTFKLAKLCSSGT